MVIRWVPSFVFTWVDEVRGSGYIVDVSEYMDASVGRSVSVIRAVAGCVVTGGDVACGVVAGGRLSGTEASGESFEIHAGLRWSS